MPSIRLQATTKIQSTPILLSHSNAWGFNLKEIKITSRNQLLQEFDHSDLSADTLYEGLG